MRRISPGGTQLLALLRTNGADRATHVIIFKTDFNPSGFDRPVTGPFQDEVRSKLNGAGVRTLTLVFKRGPHGELILHFDGPDEDIARAKAALPIAQIDPPSNGQRV